MNVKFGCRHVLRSGGVGKPEWTLLRTLYVRTAMQNSCLCSVSIIMNISNSSFIKLQNSVRFSQYTVYAQSFDALPSIEMG